MSGCPSRHPKADWQKVPKSVILTPNRVSTGRLQSATTSVWHNRCRRGCTLAYRFNISHGIDADVARRSASSYFHLVGCTIASLYVSRACAQKPISSRVQFSRIQFINKFLAKKGHRPGNSHDGQISEIVTPSIAGEIVGPEPHYRMAFCGLSAGVRTAA